MNPKRSVVIVLFVCLLSAVTAWVYGTSGIAAAGAAPLGNHPPVFSPVASRGVVVGRTCEFRVDATDPDDPATPEGQLVYAADRLPPGARFDPDTRVFSWAVTEADKGIHTATFSVRDNEYTAVMEVRFETVVAEVTPLALGGSPYGSSSDDLDLYDDKLVWVDSSGYVKMYDLGTGQVTAIDPSATGYGPRIFGDRIVWSRWSLGDKYPLGNYDIFMYDIKTGQALPLATGPANQMFPDIEGERVVYQNRNGPDANTPSDIYLLDLETGLTKPLTADASNQGQPRISGDKIVWEDDRNGSGNRDVYLYNATTNTETQITTDGAMQYAPKVFGDRIAWSDMRAPRGQGVISNAYLYDLSTLQERRIGTAEENPLTSSWKNATDIYEDKVAFAHSTMRQTGATGVWLPIGEALIYDLSTSLETQISSDLIRLGPKIYQDRMVWQTAGDVFVARVSFYPQVDAGCVASTQGAPLDITGKNFGYVQGNSQVRIDNGLPCPVEHWSNTAIRCRVPEGASASVVSVHTRGGDSSGVVVTVCNGAPVLDPIGSREAVSGQLLEIVVSALDPDADELGFSATPLPAGAAFTGQAFSWTPTRDQVGTHEISFTVSDGLHADHETIAITVRNPDTMPPTGNIQIKGGAAFTNTTAVTLNLSATDIGGSGLDSMRFANGGGSPSAWKPFQTTQAWTLSSGTGTKTVWVQFRDRDGNISDADPVKAGAQAYSDQIVFDPAAPTGSILINNGASSTKTRSVTLNLLATDTGPAGLDAMRFVNGGGTTTAWEPYQSTRAWTLTSGVGTKTVWVQFRDKAGNISDADPVKAGFQSSRATILYTGP